METMCCGIKEPSTHQLTNAIVSKTVKYLLFFSPQAVLYIAATNVPLLHLDLGYVTLRDIMMTSDKMISEMITMEMVKDNLLDHNVVK